jgi:serine protease
VGVIISNNASGLFSGTLNGSYPLPVVGLSQADGDVLQAASGVQTTVTIGLTGHGYASYSGTSMSTPHVAGVAGLIIGDMLPRRFTAEQIRTALESTAQDLGDVGRDDLFGYGNVQAPGALAYLQGLPGCTGDWDQDGDADSDDVLAFFSAWETGDADADGDSDSDSDDIVVFFASWDAGC